MNPSRKKFNNFWNINNYSEQLTRTFEVFVLRNCGFHHDSRSTGCWGKRRRSKASLQKLVSLENFKFWSIKAWCNGACSVCAEFIPRPVIMIFLTKSSTFVHFLIIFGFLIFWNFIDDSIKCLQKMSLCKYIFIKTHKLSWYYIDIILTSLILKYTQCPTKNYPLFSYSSTTKGNFLWDTV